MAGLICNQCGQPKAESEMSKDSSDRRGHRGICKACSAKRSADYRTRNPEKYKNTLRVCARNRLYGPDGIAHFEEQRQIQNGECAICHQPMEKACSDHDHETGKWRGLLCDSCNRGIGLLKDSVEVLASAICYLNKWKA